MTAAWRVASWPPLLWQAHAAPSLQLVHLATRIVHDGGDEQPCSGHTVWATRASGGPAGVAWDWVLMPQGALALVDPLALLTNLWLLDGAGQVLSPLQAAPHLNGIVHGLPWQDTVQRALDGARPA